MRLNELIIMLFACCVPVLEFGEAHVHSFNYSCSGWRWIIGLRDVWLHPLLRAPWAAKEWSATES